MALRAGTAGWSVDFPLSPGELLELAAWLERTGVEFYRLLSEELKQGKLRKFFLKLMGMEMEHEKKMRDLLGAVDYQPREKLPFDEDLTGREYFLHLRSLSAKRVFPQGFELFKNLDRFERPEDALPWARDVEKNMIEILKALRRFKLSPDSLGVIDGLIQEEDRHFNEINEILDSL